VARVLLAVLLLALCASPFTGPGRRAVHWARVASSQEASVATEGSSAAPQQKDHSPGETLPPLPQATVPDGNSSAAQGLPLAITVTRAGPSAGGPEPFAAARSEPLPLIRKVNGVYVPTPAQLASAAEALSGKTIQVSGRVSRMSRPMAAGGTTEVTLEDGRSVVVFAWKDCPEQVARIFERRSTNASAVHVGSQVDVTGTLVSGDGIGVTYVRPTNVRVRE
jgi:hypothetical protein